MSNNIVISGGQWGDEGKAKITDLLSQRADYIVRFQGGANAGHTVCVGDKSYKFHLIPSGILFPDKISIIGPGTVIEPSYILQEITNLKEQGMSLENLRISGLAHVTMPWHILIDKAGDKVGSTGRGIGPTYTDKFKRVGICMFDLLDQKLLENKLDKFLPEHNNVLEKLYNLPAINKQEVLEQYLSYGNELREYITDTTQLLYIAYKQNKKILFEGAQGALLDVTFGTYPFVTSSNPIAGGASVGSGLGPTAINHSLGIFKAFTSRVGLGPFPLELDENSPDAANLRQDNTQWAEYGTTTGRKRRVGWFDAVLARYAIRINTYTSIALTKLDTLDQFETLYICNEYKSKSTGEIIKDIEYLDESILEQYEPVMTELKGWNTSTFEVNKFEQLPELAQGYIKHISNILEIPVSIISTGPAREDSIFIDNNIF